MTWMDFADRHFVGLCVTVVLVVALVCEVPLAIARQRRRWHQRGD